MSVNSSSSHSFVLRCVENGSSISSSFIITKLFLIVPLSILVLCMGQRQWRQQRSFATASHSDMITYHTAAVELIFLLAVTFYFSGSCSGRSDLILVGAHMSAVVFPGQISFHTLTCVDRYLAVVHPIAYLSLRQSGGVRIRNISIGCVWLLGLGWIGLTALHFPDPPYIPFFCLLVFSLVVVSFCSICVLRVLAGDGERVDQAKQRAFHTIVAIMGVLWLFFAGFLICLGLDKSQLLSYAAGCVVLISANWMTLPSSLVLPLLYLHRAGKLPCSHSSNR